MDYPNAASYGMNQKKTSADMEKEQLKTGRNH